MESSQWFTSEKYASETTTLFIYEACLNLVFCSSFGHLCFSSIIISNTAAVIPWKQYSHFSINCRVTRLKLKSGKVVVICWRRMQECKTPAIATQLNLYCHGHAVDTKPSYIISRQFWPAINYYRTQLFSALILGRLKHILINSFDRSFRKANTIIWPSDYVSVTDIRKENFCCGLI